mmetsp:Transcript_42286/g.128291  ORF Transcript_42286/g.128291 Transcript_42286/m.128291 type:complete len:204 (+) Transcript_42286:490-1101(+)
MRKPRPRGRRASNSEPRPMFIAAMSIRAAPSAAAAAAAAAVSASAALPRWSTRRTHSMPISSSPPAPIWPPPSSSRPFDSRIARRSSRAKSSTPAATAEGGMRRRRSRRSTKRRNSRGRRDDRRTRRFRARPGVPRGRRGTIRRPGRAGGGIVARVGGRDRRRRPRRRRPLRPRSGSTTARCPTPWPTQRCAATSTEPTSWER